MALRSIVSFVSLSLAMGQFGQAPQGGKSSSNDLMNTLCDATGMCGNKVRSLSVTYKHSKAFKPCYPSESCQLLAIRIRFKHI